VTNTPTKEKNWRVINGRLTRKLFCFFLKRVFFVVDTNSHPRTETDLSVEVRKKKPRKKNAHLLKILSWCAQLNDHHSELMRSIR
jgi:hypothetical protein